MYSFSYFFPVEEETTCDLKISPDRVFPFAFPIFADEDDPLVSTSHNSVYKITALLHITS